MADDLATAFTQLTTAACGLPKADVVEALEAATRQLEERHLAGGHGSNPLGVRPGLVRPDDIRMAVRRSIRT